MRFAQGAWLAWLACAAACSEPAPSAQVAARPKVAPTASTPTTARPQQEPASPPGLRRLQLAVADTGATADVVTADLSQVRLVGLDARTEHRAVATVDELRAEADAHVAVNGTFFDEALRPLGLLVSEGVTRSPLRTADWGVLFVAHDGVVDLVHTEQFRPSPSIDFAVQCGPRVVIDGRPPSLKRQVARRTGICIQGPRQVALFVVAFPVEANALAAWLATPQREQGLGCTDALLLDGGPSSQLDERGGSTHPAIPGGWGVPNAIGLVTRTVG